MGDMERTMGGESWFPRIWLRYVDDIFAIVKRGDTEKILEKLNGMSEKIKFTCEEEKNGQLPFLDLLLEREDGEVVFDIYRKPTDARLCIPNHSHHP